MPQTAQRVPPPERSDRLPIPVRQWLDRLAARDLDGLVQLYDAEASLDGLHEALRGRDEIRERLAVHWRRLRNLRLDEARPLRTRAGQVEFETVLDTLLGRARIQHKVRVRHDLIQEHVLQVVEFRKALPCLGGGLAANSA